MLRRTAIQMCLQGALHLRSAPLTKKIKSPSHEDLRLVPRLLSTRPPSPTPMAIKPEVSYLITGGLGGLGPHIAAWLVNNGARHLILCGRRELPERSAWEGLSPLHLSYEQVAAIQKLEKLGATVHIEKVDVSDRGQMEELFESFAFIRAPWPESSTLQPTSSSALCER